MGCYRVTAGVFGMGVYNVVGGEMEGKRISLKELLRQVGTPDGERWLGPLLKFIKICPVLHKQKF